MENVVYINIVDTKQQLWKSIQNAENEIFAIPGVLKCIQTLFWNHADASIHAHREDYEHLF